MQTLLALLVAASTISSDGGAERTFREWRCASTEWPDVVRNEDGVLQLLCSPAPAHCDNVRNAPAPVCVDVWLQQCTSANYVNALRGRMAVDKDYIECVCMCNSVVHMQ
jgi:hypothetical protein